MTKPRAILIAGPTASGKSALAVRLARERHGVVINADSMQVYRDLSILTARPSDEDLGAARHSLYGYVDGAEAYSVARWLADAAEAMAECWQEGFTPIVVGGTGLYFKALLEGLSPVPPVPDAIRAHWRTEALRLGPTALHALLAGRDPDTAARLKPTDPQRLTRALEVLEATGRGMADWQRERGRPVVAEADTERLVLAPDRAALYARADARLDAMISAGALAEASALGARRLPDDLPVMRALGVRPLIEAAAVRTTIEAALARTKLDTRHYIKRQQTWLRRHMIAWNYIFAQ